MNAGVAQRTEQTFSKLLDPGSNPVTRSGIRESEDTNTVLANPFLVGAASARKVS